MMCDRPQTLLHGLPQGSHERRNRRATDQGVTVTSSWNRPGADANESTTMK